MKRNRRPATSDIHCSMHTIVEIFITTAGKSVKIIIKNISSKFTPIMPLTEFTVIVIRLHYFKLYHTPAEYANTRCLTSPYNEARYALGGSRVLQNVVINVGGFEPTTPC